MLWEDAHPGCSLEALARRVALCTCSCAAGLADSRTSQLQIDVTRSKCVCNSNGKPPGANSTCVFSTCRILLCMQDCAGVVGAARRALPHPPYQRSRILPRRGPLRVCHLPQPSTPALCSQPPLRGWRFCILTAESQLNVHQEACCGCFGCLCTGSAAMRAETC